MNKEELKEAAGQSFAANPHLNELFQTSDGQCFTSEERAKQHAKNAGGEVEKVRRWITPGDIASAAEKLAAANKEAEAKAAEEQAAKEAEAKAAEEQAAKEAEAKAAEEQAAKEAEAKAAEEQAAKEAAAKEAAEKKAAAAKQKKAPAKAAENKANEGTAQ